MTIFYWNLFQALSEELLSNGGQEEILFGLENMDLTGEGFLFLKKFFVDPLEMIILYLSTEHYVDFLVFYM